MTIASFNKKIYCVYLSRSSISSFFMNLLPLNCSLAAESNRNLIKWTDFELVLLFNLALIVRNESTPPLRTAKCATNKRSHFNSPV